MILVCGDDIDSCVSSILLEKLSRKYNKNMSIHFIKSKEINIVIKQILTYYVPIDSQKFIWIVGQNFDASSHELLSAACELYPNIKFIYCNPNKNDISTRICKILQKYVNFKEIDCKNITSSKCIYDFMLSKNYIDEHKLPNMIESWYDENNSDFFTYDLFFKEFGFHHTKETFFTIENNRIINLQATLLERYKNNISKLYKKGTVQIDDKVIIAITENSILDELVYFSKKDKSIINLVAREDNSIDSIIYIYDCEYGNKIERLHVSNFFKSEILKEGFLNPKKSVYEIRLKEGIKYTSALNILKYILSELQAPF